LVTLVGGKLSVSGFEQSLYDGANLESLLGEPAGIEAVVPAEPSPRDLPLGAQPGLLDITDTEFITQRLLTDRAPPKIAPVIGDQDDRPSAARLWREAAEVDPESRVADPWWHPPRFVRQLPLKREAFHDSAVMCSSTRPTVR
jgi:hypothetical protein